MTEGAGCTPRTVRYYERQGLLTAERTAGGHRQFAPAELERLEFVIALREAGWSLEDVTALLQMRDTAASDADATASLRTVLDEQIEALHRKLELLQRLRDEFGETAELLTVCGTCTAVQLRVSCEGCERLPDLGALPRPFRQIWRTRELGRGAPLFEDTLADE
ncbi:MAG: MerR family transcriptional regulator [Nannocystales bacterium]